jgi:hypothetical protein
MLTGARINIGDLAHKITFAGSFLQEGKLTTVYDQKAAFYAGIDGLQANVQRICRAA